MKVQGGCFQLIWYFCTCLCQYAGFLTAAEDLVAFYVAHIFHHVVSASGLCDWLFDPTGHDVQHLKCCLFAPYLSQSPLHFDPKWFPQKRQKRRRKLSLQCSCFAYFPNSELKSTNSVHKSIFKTGIWTMWIIIFYQLQCFNNQHWYFLADVKSYFN